MIVRDDDVEEIRKGWFVVFDPGTADDDRDGDAPGSADARGAALVALTDDDSEWEGAWTIGTESARRVAAYLDDEYGTE